MRRFLMCVCGLVLLPCLLFADGAAGSKTIIVVTTAGGSGGGVAGPDECPPDIPPDYGVSKEVILEYSLLNDAEERLLEYKDNPRLLRMKLAVLEEINKSRLAYKCSLLRLDILASRVANKQAMEAAKNNYSGHWNMAGEKPYHRYAFAGGVDHITENAFWTGYSRPVASVVFNPLATMLNGHKDFMAEKAPYDGHKLNVIAKEHTHVGLGFFATNQACTYYEEYLDRYLEFISWQPTVPVGSTASITVKPLFEGYHVYAAMGYYEPVPAPMTPQQIKAKGSYPDYTSSTAFSLWPDSLAKKEDGSTDIVFTPKKKGLYYIQVFLDTKEPPSGFNVSYHTTGKIQASGLVIRVE